MNISIDNAVEPSGLCGLVVRTFVTSYGIRLRGLWGSQVRILSETNFSHILSKDSLLNEIWKNENPSYFQVHSQMFIYMNSNQISPLTT